MWLLKVWMWMALIALWPGAARASVGSCGAGDAPSGYTSAGCNSVCTENGSELTCQLQVICTNIGSQADIVTGYQSSTHDVSAWGGCLDGGQTKFCCVFDEGATNITTVTLRGTNSADEVLEFHYTDGSITENLEPWDSDDIDGYILGLSGNDQIHGSDYDGADYKDHVNGGGGADEILGHDGDDDLWGNSGDDHIQGGLGADKLWGGDGDDTLEGGYGDDALCDATGYDVCATDGEGIMNGGNGDDELWWEESEDPQVPCPGILLDLTNSTGGSQSVRDQCGDNSNFDSSELPLNCESYITVKPTRCDGAH